MYLGSQIVSKTVPSVMQQGHSHLVSAVCKILDVMPAM
jgi:hypothetical protein